MIPLERSYILRVKSVFLFPSQLVGWAASKAQWPGNNWGSPYAISVADLTDYIDQSDSYPQSTYSPTPFPASKDSTGHSRNRNFFHPTTRNLKVESARKHRYLLSQSQEHKHKTFATHPELDLRRVSAKQVR